MYIFFYGKYKILIIFQTEKFREKLFRKNLLNCNIIFNIYVR